MIRSLHLKQCFTHRDRRFEFGRGLTVITGPNESGKSLILEMIRFALFGSAALRGTAEDYRKLEITLCLEIQGVPYEIRRRGNRAWLDRGGAPLAEGIRPVNAAVRRVLGYDMAVFDTANACNQGQIEALGAMSSGQRKQMVDQTVGLSSLEAVGQWVGEQARAFEREAEAMSRVLEAPTPPPVPEGYAPLSELTAQVEALHAQEQTRAELVGWLAHEIAAPEAPICPCDTPADALAAQVEARRAVAAAHQRVEARLAATPEATLDEATIAEGEAAWALWHRVQERRRALAGLIPPSLSDAIIEAEEAQWAAYDRWQAKAELLAHGELSCPACGHEWPQAAEALAAYEDVEPVEPPAHDRAALARARAVNVQWAETAEVRARYAETPDSAPRPGRTEAALAAARRALEAAEARAALESERASLAAELARLPDMEALLEARRRYDAQQAAWADAQARYEVWQAERASRAAALEALTDVPAQLAEAQRRLTRATVYEEAQRRYAADLSRYEAALADLEARQAEAGHWRAARKALVALRGQIKGFLLPSLNAVASRLLSQMTGGRRGDVQVDDQFNIKVDGQPLATLSGSGKAVANLALRLALGQVLTHRVFPVFLADEVDAAMDRDRAGFTVEALRGLSRIVDQVILVSHKELDCPQMIRL